MNKKKLFEPSFLVSVLNCILLIVLLFISRNHVEPASARSSSEHSATPGTNEIDEALDLCVSYQKSGDYESAYDMLMVASRIAPSDPRLFDHAMTFVEAATEGNDEGYLILAEDILSRGDSLVHFQNPENVQSARKRLTEIRASLINSETPPQIISPLDTLEALIDLAENTSVDMSVRTQATEELRNRLKSVFLEEAIFSDEEESFSPTLNELRELQSRLDAAEKECVRTLFQTTTSKASKWIKKSKSLLSKEDLPAEDVPDHSNEISQMINSGYSIMSEIRPYAGADVADASNIERAVGDQIRMLERQKSWIYNQQVLRLIREVESKDDWKPEDKIRHLAEVREELLAPYVLRRHNVMWENVFESLPDEKSKIAAVKRRILGRKALANEE